MGKAGTECGLDQFLVDIPLAKRYRDLLKFTQNIISGGIKRLFKPAVQPGTVVAEKIPSDSLQRHRSLGQNGGPFFPRRLFSGESSFQVRWRVIESRGKFKRGYNVG